MNKNNYGLFITAFLSSVVVSVRGPLLWYCYYIMIKGSHFTSSNFEKNVLT